MPANLQQATNNVSPTVDNYTDPNTSQFTGIRTLMSTGYALKALGATANCGGLPLGTASSCNSSFAPNIARTFWTMPIRPAPPTYDGVDRETFVPRTITFPIAGTQTSPGESLPMGTAKVAIKFGYDSNLYPSQNRAETGYVVTATVNESNPYLWESEWTTEGVSCASSCTVQIPSIWGGVLQYQAVYLDSMGSVISTGTQRMEVADPLPTGGTVLRKTVIRGGFVIR
jgi:hypothetical protein